MSQQATQRVVRAQEVTIMHKSGTVVTDADWVNIGSAKSLAVQLDGQTLWQEAQPTVGASNVWVVTDVNMPSPRKP